MQARTRAAVILIVAFLCGVAPTTAASDGGWILWGLTVYMGDAAELARQGFSDRWSVEDGFDTAVDCHAAVKGLTPLRDALNESTMKSTRPRYSGYRCFPIAFDPRLIERP